MVSLWINPFGTYIFQFIFPATAICIFIVCCFVHCNLWNNFASNTPQTCSQWTPFWLSRFSLHFTRLWAALHPLSLSPELENRKTEHSHRPEEQFRGEGSFKKLFSVGQHPLLYFAHFVCTPPLRSLHPFSSFDFVLPFFSPSTGSLSFLFFPPGDALQTQYSWRGRKTDDFWLPPPLSSSLC